MAYVGLVDRNEAERLERYRRIVDLLEEANHGSNVHPDNPFILANYQRRVDQMERGEEPTPREQGRFYAALFRRTTVPETRERLARQLRMIDVEDDLVVELLKTQDQLERQRLRDAPYAPLDLYLFLLDGSDDE